MNNTYSLEKLFTARLFVVPDYQRGYAWEKNHREDFLDDLELLADGHQHYTGTVVLHSKGGDDDGTLDEEGRSSTRYEVVDGQQRITTAVILLDVLQRAFCELGRDRLASGIRKSYVSVTGINGQPLFRLQLNADCREFFEEVVLADEPAPTPATIRSQARLREAHDEFTAFLEKHRAREDFEAWALRLYQKLTQQLRFTVYEVGSSADVGVIFEVMNNRGKPLSDLEKVKNYLLYLSSKLEVPSGGLADRVNATWAEIFEGMMVSGLTNTQDENRLLRVHWLATQHYDQRKWAQTDSIKGRFSLRDFRGRHRELLAELTQYTASLKSASIAVCDAQSPRRDHAFSGWGTRRAEAAEVTERLLRTRASATFLPVLVAVRLRHANDADAYIAMTRLCERFAFRVYRLDGRRSNTGRSALNALAHDIYQGLDIESALRRGYGLLLGYSSDASFRGNLEKVGNWYGWSGLRALLYGYEEFLAGKRGVRVSWHEIEKRDRSKTIEHILPQTANRRHWTSKFKKPDRERWTHDLGNLVLTMNNSELSNRAFREKKGTSTQDRPCYANSVLLQERELEKWEDWTPEAVEERRASIVAWALDRWAVPDLHRTATAEEAVDEYDDDLLESDS